MGMESWQAWNGTFALHPGLFIYLLTQTFAWRALSPIMNTHIRIQSFLHQKLLGTLKICIGAASRPLVWLVALSNLLRMVFDQRICIFWFTHLWYSTEHSADPRWKNTCFSNTSTTVQSLEAGYNPQREAKTISMRFWCPGYATLPVISV